jgi:hypothetical protein
VWGRQRECRLFREARRVRPFDLLEDIGGFGRPVERLGLVFAIVVSAT